jgi:hypothetical protein
MGKGVWSLRCGSPLLIPHQPEHHEATPYDHSCKHHDATLRVVLAAVRRLRTRCPPAPQDPRAGPPQDHQGQCPSMRPTRPCTGSVVALCHIRARPLVAVPHSHARAFAPTSLSRARPLVAALLICPCARPLGSAPLVCLCARPLGTVPPVCARSFGVPMLRVVQQWLFQPRLLSRCWNSLWPGLVPMVTPGCVLAGPLALPIAVVACS